MGVSDSETATGDADAPPRRFDAEKAVWILTHNCNLDCPYCYVRDRTDNYPLEHRVRIADELADYGFESVAFTGGDPLAYWDQLSKLLPRLDDADLSLDTNGSFVTEEVVAELAEYDGMEVRMSLNGSCAEVHDASRGEGAFEDVVAAARLCREYGVDFAFGTTILPSNADDVDGICELAADLGADSVGFHGFLPTVDAAGQFDRLLDPGEYHEVVRDVKAAHEEWAGDLSVYAGGTLPFTFLLDEDLRECYLELGDEVSMCSLGRKVNVAPSGDVVPCLYLRDSMGNLLEEDLDDIMTSERARRYRRLAASGERGDPCGSCAYSDACGGCPVAELAFEGDLDAGDPRCWVGSA